ncbi:LLM class flavin-dependent oxidoreductase [Nocardia sp. XZ_19_369]|uniref:LLM class flavin-dependent oxidoreductase n=1 Tax=Nocardia sp. XZ_19_369 TaxID=2769487 RepID=UPI00188E6DF0|nr:LLM class flavin-dependent oxidoreductase [Nocardia sp. XZ_19_369]
MGLREPELPPSFATMSASALAAEAAGFTSVLVTVGHTNNHFDQRVGYPDSIVMASALAPVTTAVKLLVAIRPGSVDAAAGARIGATLDQVSGGRFMINVVAGAVSARQYGERLDDVDRYHRAGEFADVLKALWTGSDASYDGTFYRLHNANCWPRPLQRPHPPIYFAGSSEATMNISVRHGDALLVPGAPLGAAATKAALVRERALAAGRRVRLGIHFYVVARKSAPAALDAAADLVGHADPAVRHFLGGSDDPHPVTEDDGIVYWNGLRRLWRRASVALVGSYIDVTDALRRYSDVGYDTFVVSAFPAAHEAERLGHEIIPRLKGIPPR